MARGLLKSAVGFGGVAFVAAQAAAGASNAGFHVVVSRLLGPADYGALGALLAILAVITVPATTLETLLTARVAAAVAQGRPPAARSMLCRAAVVGAVAAGLLLSVAPHAAAWLALTSVAPMVWLAVYCLPMSVSVAAWALVCGQRRFASAGAVALTAVAARLGFALLFVSLGYGVAGALAASVCSDSLRAALLVAAARIRRLNGRATQPASGVYRQALSSTAAFGLLWMFMGADTILARRLFEPVLAGQYAAAAMATRSVLILTHAMCLVVIPVFATAGHRRAAGALRRSVAVAAGLGFLVTVVITALGPRLVPAVLGEAFLLPRDLLALLGIAATALGVLWIVVQYQLARTGRAVGAVWAGLAAAVAGVASTDATPNTLAMTMIIAAVVSLTLAARGAARPSPPVRSGPPHRRPMASDVDLTMVVPYHNPGPQLRPTLLRLVAALRDSDVRFEVIAVADGCTDGSPGTIADLDPRTVRRLSLPRNLGKGAALQLGLREGRGRHLGFIDADGDLDPDDLRAFVALLKLYDPDAVVGAKYHPLSRVDGGPDWRRRAYSLGYRGLIRLLFPTLPVSDTQVGIKVFRRQLLDDVLPHSAERGFVFDLELLALAHRMGYCRVLPAPVVLRRRGRTTVQARTVWRMLTATVALAWRVRSRCLHAESPQPRPALAIVAHGQLAVAPVSATPAGYREA